MFTEQMKSDLLEKYPTAKSFYIYSSECHNCNDTSSIIRTDEIKHKKTHKCSMCGGIIDLEDKDITLKFDR